MLRADRGSTDTPGLEFRVSQRSVTGGYFLQSSIRYRGYGGHAVVETLEAWVVLALVQTARSIRDKIFDRVGTEAADGAATGGHRILQRLLGTKHREAAQIEAGLRKAMNADLSAAEQAELAEAVGAILTADPEIASWIARIRDRAPTEAVPAGTVQGESLRAVFETIEQSSKAALLWFCRGLGPEVHRLYVEGLAGTGKTVLALTLAGLHAQRVRSSGGSALYLCYSEPLAMELAATTGSYPGASGVAIHTPESLFSALVPNPRPALDRFAEDAQHDAHELALLLGLDPPVAPSRDYLDSAEFWEPVHAAGPRFAAVLVDEAQDLTGPAFHALAALTEPDGLFAVLADPRQVTRAERAGRPWYRPTELAYATVRSLEHNFRNTRAIAEEVIARARVEYLFLETAPAGREVGRLHWHDGRSLQAALDAAVAQVGAKGGQDEGAVILVQDDSSVPQLAALSQAGHYAGVPVHTIDAYKGRECLMAILVLGPVTGMDAVGSSAEQLYVGLTRAVSHAIVIEHRHVRGKTTHAREAIPD